VAIVNKLPKEEDINSIIIETLKALSNEVFQQSGQLKLTDKDNNEPHITMTSELAECFFVPAIYSGLRDEIEDFLPYERAEKLIKAICNKYSESMKIRGLGFVAGGYLMNQTDTKQVYEVVDAASFALTACLHFRRLYYNKIENNNQLMKETSVIIDESLRFLRGCCADEGLDEQDLTGYCWGRAAGKKLAYRYFTYVAVDGLMDYYEYAMDMNEVERDKVIGSSYGLKQDIEDQLSLVALNLLKNLDDENLLSGEMLELEDDVEKYSVSSYYFNIWTIYSVLAIRKIALSKGAFKLIDKKRLISSFEKLAKYYVNNVAREDTITPVIINLGRFDENDKAEKIGEWSDRSFTPLLLKAFATYCKNVAERTTITDEFVSKIYESLILMRADTDLWDKAGGGYSIYFTERAIEALVKLKQYLLLAPPSNTKYNMEEKLSGVDKVSLTIDVNVEELKKLIQCTHNSEVNEDIIGDRLIECMTNVLTNKLTDKKVGNTIQGHLDDASYAKNQGDRDSQLAILMMGIVTLGTKLRSGRRQQT